MNWSLISNVTFVGPGEIVQHRNRFLPPNDIFRQVVNYEQNLEVLLQRSHQHLDDSNIKKMIRPRHLSGSLELTFEVLQFTNQEGVSEGLASVTMSKLGFTPACITEMLTFVSVFRKSLENDSMVALGSSTANYLAYQEASRSILQQLIDFVRRKNRPNISYPITTGGEDSLVKLAEGGDKKFNRHVYFLAVHQKHLGDMKLVDFEIHLHRYEELPKLADLSEKQILDSELEQLFVARDGHLCQLVKGEDMFAHQVGGGMLGLPARGLRHYRPVFK